MKVKTIIFDLDGTLVQLKPEFQSFVDKEKLIKLSRDYELAIITGATRTETKSALKRAGINMFFNERFIVTSDDVSASKSTGESFRELLRRIRGNVIMIGDSDSDETGASVAGIPFIRVNTTTTVLKQKANLSRAISIAVEFRITR